MKTITEPRHGIFYKSFWGTVGVLSTLVILAIGAFLVLTVGVVWMENEDARKPAGGEAKVREGHTLTPRELEASRQVQVVTWKMTPTEGDGIWHGKLSVTLRNRNDARAYGSMRLGGYDKHGQKCCTRLLPAKIDPEQSLAMELDLVFSDELWSEVREWRLDWPLQREVMY